MIFNLISLRIILIASTLVKIMFKQWYKPTHYHAFLILNTFMVLISIKLDLELHSNADVSRCYRLNRPNILPKMTLLTVSCMFSRRITIATAPIKGPNI